MCRTRRSGLTLLETIISLSILLGVTMLVQVSVLAQASGRDMFWSRRVAARIIETQLEQACYNSGLTPTGFDDNLPLGAEQLITTFPADVSGLLPSLQGWRTISLDGGDPDLKMVTVRLQWIIRGHVVEDVSGPYRIAHSGLCSQL